MDSTFYRALLERDPRFDRIFFVGVHTTGIYCRSICPAKKPLRKNVSFYPTKTSAEKAGFRPCRRCRPEAAPGSPAWNGSLATVNRALRLLSDEKIPVLARRLGMSDRRLRQLFREHLGASPRAVFLDRRLRLARRMVEDTRLPLTQVAFQAGFESIRRFNDAFKKRFGVSPREVRHAL